ACVARDRAPAGAREFSAVFTRIDPAPVLSSPLTESTKTGMSHRRRPVVAKAGAVPARITLVASGGRERCMRTEEVGAFRLYWWPPASPLGWLFPARSGS